MLNLLQSFVLPKHFKLFLTDTNIFIFTLTYTQIGTETIIVGVSTWVSIYTHIAVSVHLESSEATQEQQAHWMALKVSDTSHDITLCAVVINVTFHIFKKENA